MGTDHARAPDQEEGADGNTREGPVRGGDHQGHAGGLDDHVTADSREDACEQADAIVSNCMFPEFEMIESGYHFDANPIDAWHHAEPTREDVGAEMVCRLCLNRVLWTGMARDDPMNRTGTTTPGPWIHAPS